MYLHNIKTVAVVVYCFKLYYSFTERLHGSDTYIPAKVYVKMSYCSPVTVLNELTFEPGSPGPPCIPGIGYIQE